MRTPQDKFYEQELRKQKIKQADTTFRIIVTLAVIGIFVGFVLIASIN